MRKQLQAGYTLVELMVSIAIVGILSSAAIPTMVRYIQKAKTTEAREFLEKINAGARTYFLDPQIKPGEINPTPAQFPNSEALTPALPCCTTGKCEPQQAQWTTAGWTALAFSVDEPHYYQYEFRSSGTSIASKYTAMAVGNLDCDAQTSTFMLQGEILPSGDPTKAANLSRTGELE